MIISMDNDEKNFTNNGRIDGEVDGVGLDGKSDSFD